MQNSDAQSSANKATSAAEKAAEPGLEANNALLQLAKAYNPSQSNQVAIDQATAQTQNTLGNTLKGLGAGYAASGGVPGNSSAFNVTAQQATNQTLGPFAQWVAQLKANEPMQKMQAYQAVNQGQTGQLAQSYFKNAEFAQNNAPTGALNLLAQGIGKMINPGTAGSSPTGTTSVPASAGNIGYTPYATQAADQSYNIPL